MLNKALKITEIYQDFFANYRHSARYTMDYLMQEESSYGEKKAKMPSFSNTEDCRELFVNNNDVVV